jgi:hypothetical protein
VISVVGASQAEMTMARWFDGKRESMKDAILKAIAEHSIFSEQEVERVFEIYRSYDLIVSACDFCAFGGFTNLEYACGLVRLSDSRFGLNS